LQKAVSEGRRNEFKDFDFETVPDPQDPATFERSKLNWLLAEGENTMLEWYATLLDLRRKYVINSDRTCKAELRDGIITMQVPAEEPRLKLFARIQGDAALPDAGAGWVCLTHLEEAERTRDRLVPSAPKAWEGTLWVRGS
jgi:hypothetical protein